jgi:uncharacterized protein (TIGR03083 family)
MEFVPHFHREVVAFQAAAHRTVPADGDADAHGAPLVPSCPGWSVSDLVIHLGAVHRYVARVITERLTEQADGEDRTFLTLPTDLRGWPRPEDAPNRGPVPPGLLDWFTAGAAALESLFETHRPDETVWTWSRDQSVGFWVRIQTIEAAVHRWDAENAIGTAQPVEADLAADAIGHTFEIMAPARRAWRQAPPGSGERFRFRQADGTATWMVHFAGDEVRLTETTETAGPCDVELAGTASDLMLFLWQRLPAERLDVTGDRDVLDRYFTLVPPV